LLQEANDLIQLKPLSANLGLLISSAKELE
jgi:hypothetical protein